MEEDIERVKGRLEGKTMEILDLMESLAKERCIDLKDVKEAMESVLKDFAVSRYGNEEILQVELDSHGSFEVFLEQTVVDGNPIDFDEISYERAVSRNPKIQIGDVLKEVLPFKLGRSDVIKILSVLKDKLNIIQKAKEYEIFSKRVGTILVGYVRRVDFSEALITFSDGEGILRKGDMISNEILRAGSYVKVYVKEVKENRGRQIFLSRAHEGFLRELMKAEVPEIQDGFVEIKAVARDPGSLAKIAVYPTRPGINPISVCIGAYGARVQAVSKELASEKISLVEWNENINQFIANALLPASVLRINERVVGNKYEAVVSQDQFSKAMGRGGQNVSLAKRLCNVGSIKLLTEEQDAERYQEMTLRLVAEFVESLSVEEMMAHLLVAEGFRSVEQIALADLEMISEIDGFDVEIAEALKERAESNVKEKKEKLLELLKLGHFSGNLLDLPVLTIHHFEKLIEREICEKNDIAMLDSGELKDIFQDNDDLYLSHEEADEIISAARGIQRRSK